MAIITTGKTIALTSKVAILNKTMFAQYAF